MCACDPGYSGNGFNCKLYLCETIDGHISLKSDYHFKQYIAV